MSLDDPQLELYANSKRTASEAASYATKYDRELHKRVSTYFERRAIRRAVARTGLTAARVLDCPCGAGRLTDELAPVAALHVSADYSAEMVKQLERAHGPKPRLVASAFDLPFADRAFDLVFSARLSHHISDDARRADYLREVLRVSRGWAVVTIFDSRSLKNRLRELRRRFNKKRPKNVFSRERVAEIAEAAGFVVRDAIPLSRLASGHLFYVLERVDGA